VADTDAGVVDEHVDSIHHTHRIGQRGFDLHQVSDVGNDGLGYSRQLLTNGRASCGVAVEDANPRAFFQKARCGGCADAAGASGDQDSLVSQAAPGRAWRFWFR